MFTVKCPHCRHNMKYAPQPGKVTEKRKRCVYCGKSFKIHSDMGKSRIIKDDRVSSQSVSFKDAG